MGVAFIEGLQKNGLKDGVAACTKHFLGIWWRFFIDMERNFLKKYLCYMKL